MDNRLFVDKKLASDSTDKIFTLKESGATHNQSWLISSNTFNLDGAISAGRLTA